MRRLVHFLFVIPFAATLVAESGQSKKPRGDDDGVQQAIAFQRAKDRADAAQARKEARHPEHFTYAEPQHNRPDGLAEEQRREALSHSEKAADRKQQ